MRFPLYSQVSENQKYINHANLMRCEARLAPPTSASHEEAKYSQQHQAFFFGPTQSVPAHSVHQEDEQVLMY